MTSVPGNPTADSAGSAAVPPRRLRASDADRAVVVARLQEAVGRGLLSLEEGDERIAAAFAARYVDDLSGLFHDLPAPMPPAPVAPGWRHVGESLATQLRHELRTTASSGVRSPRFVGTALAAIFLIALCVAAVGALLHGIAGPGDFHHGLGDGGFGNN
jgi:hypothetical protein